MGIGEEPRDRADFGGGLWREADKLAGLRVGLVVPAIGHQFQFEPVAGLEVDDQPAHGPVHAAERVVPRIAFLPVPALLGPDGDAGLDGVRDGAADIAAEVEAVEAAIVAVHAVVQAVGRFGGDIVDRASCRVLAEQGALWTLEDFHPLEIETRVAGLVRIGEGHFVDIHADARACREARLVEAHPAQCVDGRTIGPLGKLEAGRDLHEIARVDDALLHELIAADRGNGEADIAQPFGTLLGRDDDLSGARHVRRRRQCRRRRGLFSGLRVRSVRSGRECEHADRQQNGILYPCRHVQSPRLWTYVSLCDHRRSANSLFYNGLVQAALNEIVFV